MKLVLRKSEIFIPNGNGKKVLQVIFWYLFAWAAVGYLRAPKSIVYLGDLINVWVFANAYKYRKTRIYLKDIPLRFMILFTVVGCFSAIINFESPLLLLWGLRNNVRFFMFYYSCISFLTERHFQYLLKIIRVLFWLSLPLCFFERFFVSYETGAIVGDYVGGIYYGFGGVTPPLNVLIVICCTYITIRFFEKKSSILEFAATISAAMIMSAMAELKIFVVEIVIIVVIVIIRKRVSWRTFLVCVLGITGMSLMINMFVSLNGGGRSYYTNDLFSLQSMWEIITRTTGYDGVGDLNRFSGIQILMTKYMNNNLLNILFGIGLGNADYSNYSMFTSKFYNDYSFLHYQWFSSLFVFLETGMVGLISYLMIFVSAFFQGIRKMGKETSDTSFYMIMVIFMIIFVFYGIIMRCEQSGFILFMILALPTALQREKRKNYDT